MATHERHTEELHGSAAVCRPCVVVAIMVPIFALPSAAFRLPPSPLLSLALPAGLMNTVKAQGRAMCAP